MAEVINLRLARKAKARTEAEGRAAQNRAVHGQTKAEKQRRQAEARRAARDLAAHRREVS